MAGHTPGPWHVKMNANGSFNLFAENGRMVLMCDARIINFNGNSSLIQSAPDLLDALKDMVEIGYTHEEGCHPSEDKHTWGCLAKQAALAKARDAIAKAEGRELWPLT